MKTMKAMWMAVVAAAAMGAVGCSAANQGPVVHLDAPVITVEAKRPMVVYYEAPAILVKGSTTRVASAAVPSVRAARAF